jgi:sugar lactone lactonase YvrE
VQWAEARRAARVSLEAHDYVNLRRQLETLYALSGSIWLLRELARADAMLGDRASAFGRLEAVARAGLSLRVKDDPAFASLKDDPAFTSLQASFAANATPITRGHALFALPREDLVTEDVVYDRGTHTFFVSSVRRRKILAIDTAGQARDFVAEGTYGLLSVSGLALAGGRLWATSSALPPMDGFDPKAHPPTALLAFDLRDGSFVTRVEPPSDEHTHAFTDLAAAADGTLFVADEGEEPMLYVLRPGHTALDALAARGAFISPQTAAPSPDGHTVLVADYVRGIASIALASGRLRWLTHAEDIAVTGIDGLYFDRDGSLIAVQNGIQPPRIARIILGADGARVVRVDALERATPGSEDSTHGVLVDGAFVFLAAAGWARFGDDGRLVPDAPPDGPALWSLPLR